MENVPDLQKIADDLRAVLRAGSVSMSNPELQGRQAEWELLRRLVGAGQLQTAGEVGARCEGEESLAKAENFTSAAALVSVNTGASLKESKKRLKLASRMRGEELLGGVMGPSPFPVVSAALESGVLPVETVDDITRLCSTLEERGVALEKVSGAERLLVEQTIEQGLTVDQTRKAISQLLSLLDPDGAEPRDDQLQEQRSLTYTACADGMIRGKFALTPEQAGTFVNAIQTLQSPRVTGPRFLTEDEQIVEVVAGDPRNQGQKNVDTLIEIVTRAVGAPDMPRLNGADHDREPARHTRRPRSRARGGMDRWHRRTCSRLDRTTTPLPLPARGDRVR